MASIVLVGLFTLFVVLSNKIGFRACPKCKSRLTTQHYGGRSMDSHIGAVRTWDILACMRCKHEAAINCEVERDQPRY